MHIHLHPGNSVKIWHEIKWLTDKRFSSITLLNTQCMRMKCKVVKVTAGYSKVLDAFFYSYCKQTFQLQLSQTWETLCVSQGQDLSQVLSELTRSQVYHQSWHRPTMNNVRVTNELMLFLENVNFRLLFIEIQLWCTNMLEVTWYVFTQVEADFQWVIKAYSVFLLSSWNDLSVTRVHTLPLRPIRDLWKLSY